MNNGKNSIIGGGGFHHVAIRAHDFDATLRFYTEGLGFRTKIEWGEPGKRATMLDTGDGNYLEIFEGGTKEPKPEGSILHLAFRTDDCDAAIQIVRKWGMEVTVEPKDVAIASRPHVTPVRIAFFKGPDGEVIELFQNELT